MQLLYLWIEDYKNIKQQGFNFSPLYDFHFEPDKPDENGKIVSGTLTDKITEEEREKKRDFYEDFFNVKNEKEDKKIKKGIITNVTAIVGENGVGKSSVLDLLRNSHIRKKNLIIFLEENIYTEEEELLIYYSYDYTTIRFNKMDIPQLRDKPNNYIYYDSFPFENIDSNQTNLNNNNISTGFLLKKKDSLEVGDIKRQAKLFKEELETKFLPQFKKSDIHLEVMLLDNWKSEKLSSLKTDNIYDKIRLTYIYKRAKFESMGSNEEYYKEIFELPSIDSMVEKLEKINSNISTHDTSEEYKSGHIEELIKFLKLKNIEITNYSFDLSIEDAISFLEKIPLSLQIFYFKWVSNTREKFYNDYHFSNGELALLNMIARFNFIKNEVDGKSVIILIDEGELGLHPQWQKQYLKILLETLPKIFPDKEIQLILTSHSPFLVSDLPKENVIFLEKEENTGLCKVSKLDSMKHTFGANIHTLLTDSFFMKGGLVGEFAKSKINWAMELLLDSKDIDPKDKEKIRYIISCIGEPVIRHKLMQLYDEKIKFSVEDEISKLQEKLNALIKQKEDDDTNKKK